MNLHKVKSFSVNPKEGNLAGVVTMLETYLISKC